MGKRKNPGLTIDWETADRITVHNLTDCLKLIEKDVKHLEEEMDKGDLPEYQKSEYLNNVALVKAIERLLKYFGKP